jgi:hypothetical protein
VKKILLLLMCIIFITLINVFVSSFLQCISRAEKNALWIFAIAASRWSPGLREKGKCEDWDMVRGRRRRKRKQIYYRRKTNKKC